MIEKYLKFLPEVQEAIQSGKPVVALESTIISHGMPYPQNVETALMVEQIVRDHGAIPATIALMDGKLCVGMDKAQITVLGKAGMTVTKCSRRDLPLILSRKALGATTVAATMIVAALAKIHVFATGGIGGVHREAETSFDISADLTELANTNVTVVSAGVKSILDIGLTLEYLETLGVPVLSFGATEFPAFYSRHSGFDANYRVDDVKEVARMMHAKWDLGLNGGIILANPIPEAYAMETAYIENVINEAVAHSKEKGIKGKEITPFLLAEIERRTKGKSLEANIKLVCNNAKVAAQLAVAFANEKGQD